MNINWIQQLHKKEKFDFYRLKQGETFKVTVSSKVYVLFQGLIYPSLSYHHPQYGKLQAIELKEFDAGNIFISPDLDSGQEINFMCANDSILIEFDLKRLHTLLQKEILSHQILPLVESLLQDPKDPNAIGVIEKVNHELKYQIKENTWVQAQSKNLWIENLTTFSIITKNYPVQIQNDFHGKFLTSRAVIKNERWTELIQTTINHRFLESIQSDVKDQLKIKTKQREIRLQRKLKIQRINEKFISLLSSKFKSIPDTDDTLIHCLYNLYDRLGWQPVVPPEMNTSQPVQFMANMADSSGLCMRHAKLQTFWWNFDFGNFIVFDQYDKPFVIFHKMSQNYYWNPETQEHYDLSEEFAQGLKDKAFYFYKSFEAKKLSLKDLLLFELSKVRTESITLLFIALVTSGLLTLIPLISGFIIDEILPGAQIPLLWVFSGALVLLGAFQVAYQWAQQLIEDRLESKMDLPTTAALWDRVLYFSPSVLQQYSAGDLSSRMSSFLSMQSFFRTSIQMGTYQIVQIIYSVGLMIWVSWMLGVAALGLNLIMVIVTFIFAFLQFRAFTGGEKSEGVVNSYLFEMVNNIAKIRAAGAEISIYSEWSKRYTTTKQKGLNTQKIGMAYNSFQMVWGTVTMAVIYYLTIHVKEEPVKLGQFIAFLSAMGSLSVSLNGLSQLFLGLGGQLPMIPYIKPLMTNIPEVRNDKIRPESLQGNIQLHQVSFAYPRTGVSALNNINLDIPKGRFVAIVGQSGSGKTTLAKLISTIEKPSRGKIFIDDFDIQDVDRRIIKRTISIVQQEFQVLPASIYENIRGASSTTVDEVWKILELVELKQVVEKLPLGLHTLLNGESSSLSGGQLQRIAMARALLLKPKIIIFDESTSALDNTTQKRIMSKLMQLDMTIIFIAHRLNTILAAEQVIVLDKGNMVEKGSPNELLKSGGVFASWLNESEKQSLVSLNEESL